MRDQLQSLVWQISGLDEGNLVIRNLSVGENGAGKTMLVKLLSRAIMCHSDDLNHTATHLLIPDEPASLDTQSEYDVYLRFSELTAAKATLLTSHRFSTIKMADRIVVENARIVEQGTHAHLIALNGTYADLCEKQASRYRDTPTDATAVAVESS